MVTEMFHEFSETIKVHVVDEIRQSCHQRSSYKCNCKQLLNGSFTDPLSRNRFQNGRYYLLKSIIVDTCLC